MGMKVIPREVGKVITNSRSIRELRKKISLTETQKYFVVGTVLGDGCLAPNSWGKNFRLKIEHCIEQKDYLFWKHNLLKNFTISNPKYRNQNKSWSFQTISHPDFTQLARAFYDEKRKKRVVKSLQTYIQHPFVFSVWYMDDGCLRVEKGKVYGAYINSQSFTFDENKLLQEYIKEGFGISVLLMKNHGKYRLYIPARFLPHLKKIIEPFIHESMRYKLP